MPDDKFMAKNSDIIIDGQQRINAILKYANNEFEVFGAYYRELTKREKKRFANTIFAKKKTRTFDEAILKDVYNRLNFGGVNHLAHQRAI